MVSKKSPILLALILFAAASLWCQTSSTAVTLTGVVTETSLVSNNNLHVWVQDGRSISKVCLGSASFLQERGLVPQVGDRIEVTGTRITDGSLLVANSLQMAGKDLQLRRPYSNSGFGGCQGCGCGCCGYGDCGGCDGCAHFGNHHHGHCCGHE